ncbi:MAG: HEAT repeat domain-containing protein [Gemmataceae bacterium]|nr:HEAT repeat domain-containing protein [Gemmataceae bacterium]
MDRVLPIAGVAVVSLCLTGCADTWDTLTSRKLRQDPVGVTQRMIVPEDPLVVLRADPPRDGDERAKAMRRLKEPVRNGLSQQDQDEVIDLLARAATADPSPVLRLAAIDALGRFDDPRAAGVLSLAYQHAHGRPEGAPDPRKAAVVQAVSRVPGRSAAPLVAPTGFAPDTVAVIRCRALDALGRTGQPEAARFLATVANPAPDTAPDGADDRDVRLAAVRGLAHCRHPDAVVALSQVLAAEGGKDPAVVGRAHDGLVRLTGQRLPPDPKEWEAVVQAGVVIAPEPTWVDRQIETAAGWFK